MSSLSDLGSARTLLDQDGGHCTSSCHKRLGKDFPTQFEGQELVKQPGFANGLWHLHARNFPWNLGSIPCHQQPLRFRTW
jgi:hypothetical protein